MPIIVSETAEQLLEAAVDTHVHTAPDLVGRKLDDFEAAQQARQRKMAAIVLKNHFFPTALRAALVESQVPGIRLIGSIVLNQSVGGINPWAVEAAARAGAKVVWMPTAHAEHQLRHEREHSTAAHRAGMSLPGRDAAVRVFNSGGRLTEDAETVLEIVRDRNLVLETGHLSPDEVDRLTKRALEIGVRKIVLTHPDLPVISMPVDFQKHIAQRGVYFERTFNVTRRSEADLPIDALAARIREVGFASTILATDFGQPESPLPVDGMLDYIRGLLEHGFTREQVDRMASENARALLDL